MLNGKHSRITFRVKCNTPIGQVVGISGDASELGFFRQESVITLVTTPEEYPIWRTATPLVVPTNQPLRYKYCILEGGAFREFENGDSCRTVCPSELDIVVIDDMTLPQSNTSAIDTDLDKFIEKLDIQSPPVNLLSNNRLFVLSRELPVVIRRVEGPSAFEVSWAESMLARTENSMAESMATFWIGMVTFEEGTLSVIDKEKLTEILSTLNCIPIFLDKSLSQGHYNGYCKQVLWPLFHNVEQLDSIHAVWKGVGKSVEKQKPRILSGATASGSASAVNTNAGAVNMSPPTSNSPQQSPSPKGLHKSFAPAANATAGVGIAGSVPAVSSPNNTVIEDIKWISGYYAQYAEVNKVFTGVLAPLMQAGDIIWVHDYHLMLVPALLRATNEYTVISTAVSASESEESASVATPEPVRIIFFLHIPFPTSQIFRTLPQSEELLSSLIAADVIGFHAFDYTRHFLNATSRILGVTSRSRAGGLLTLIVGDREVIVTMSHLAIEPVMLKRVLLEPKTREIAEQYALRYAGKKIFVGVDPCQRLSGLGVKFEAFDRYLQDDVKTHRAVVLIQKSIRNGSRKDDEAQTSAELMSMVNVINNRYGKRSQSNSSLLGLGMAMMPTTPPTVNSRGATGARTPTPSSMVIDYEEMSSISINHRVALWLLADVFLNTSLREGLNLLPMEYIYTRKNIQFAGCVISSEFALTTSLLSGPFKINPYDMQSIVDALQKAAGMSEKEALSRRLRDLHFITSRNSALWVRMILKDLSHLGSSEQRRQQRLQRGILSLPHMSNAAVMQCQPKPVVDNLVADCYAASGAVESASESVRGRRVFIFDYGGTLVQKEKFEIYVKKSLSALSARVPSTDVMNSLKILSDDPNNIVMICSGLGEKLLSNIFKDLPNVTIFARQGMIFSWGKAIGSVMSMYDADDIRAGQLSISRISTYEGRDWVVRDFGLDWESIQRIASPICLQFQEKVNGSTASLTIPHLGWSYFSSDPEWGYRQSSQIAIELEASLARHDVRVDSSVKGSVEILPNVVDKFTMPRLVLDRILRPSVHASTGTRTLAGRFPQFVLAVGDDSSDDSVFSSIYNALAAAPLPSTCDSPNVFTVSVGKLSCTKAECYVKSIADVESLLKAVAIHTTASVVDNVTVA